MKILFAAPLLLTAAVAAAVAGEQSKAQMATVVSHFVHHFNDTLKEPLKANMCLVVTKNTKHNIPTTYPHVVNL